MATDENDDVVGAVHRRMARDRLLRLARPFATALVVAGVIATVLALLDTLSAEPERPTCAGDVMTPGDFCVSAGGQHARDYEESVGQVRAAGRAAGVLAVAGPLAVAAGTAVLVLSARSRRSWEEATPELHLRDPDFAGVAPDAHVDPALAAAHDAVVGSVRAHGRSAPATLLTRQRYAVLLGGPAQRPAEALGLLRVLRAEISFGRERPGQP